MKSARCATTRSCTLDHYRGRRASMVVRLSAYCDLAARPGPPSSQGTRYLRGDRHRRSYSAPAPNLPRRLCHPALQRGRAECITAERHGLHRVRVHHPPGAAPGAQPALPRATGAGPLARTMSRQECRSLPQSSEGLLCRSTRFGNHSQADIEHPPRGVRGQRGPKLR